MAKNKVPKVKVTKSKSKTLRELAEEKILVKNGKMIDVNSENVKQVMQELQTHQIELEMQNEELKQSYLDLEESREKYSDLYNFAPVGYLTLNEKGIIAMSNITAHQLLRIAKTELTNTAFTKYVFNEDQDIYYLSHKKLLETKTKQQFDLRLVRSDKTYFWSHVDAVLSEKNELETLITITDISNRKKYEDEKQNILALSEATLESVNNGILAVGHKGNVIKTNSEFAKMLEIPKDIIDSGDIKLLDYVLEKLADPDEFITKVKYLYAHPEEESFDLIYFKNGRILERISKPMHIEDVNFGRVWSFLDITEQKRWENELAKQKHFFEQMFMQSSVSTQILDSDGWCEKINPKLSEIFGVEPKNIEGRIYNIFKDESIILGGIIPYLEKAFYEGKTAEWEIFFDIGIAADSQNIEVKERKKKWFSNWAYPIYDENGKIINVIIQHNDITKRKQTEEEIKQKNEELIKLNAEKDKFFSIIAHDLRSPFNVFLGFTELLKEDIHGLSLKELQTIADSMNRSAKNLFELLTNLLDWSMIKRNDYAFHPLRLSIINIINESVVLFAEAAEKKGIKLTTDTTDDIFITADESMVKTILRNLISNALKFTNKGGQVSITANISDNVASISVKDTGIGMPEDLINNLYNIDVRTNRRGTDNEPSTGLGLLLCKEFIEKHKGKMGVVSREGKGTDITVSLPLI